MSAILKAMTRTVKSGVKTKTYKVQLDPAPAVATMRKRISEFKEEQQIPPGNPIAERHELLAIQAALQRDDTALEKHLVELAKPRRAATSGAPGHNQQRRRQQRAAQDLTAAREKRLRDCYALCLLDPDKRLEDMATLGARWKGLSTTRRDRRLESYFAALRKRRAWHLLTEVVMLDLRVYLLAARVRRSLAATPARAKQRQEQRQERKGGEPAPAPAAVADVEARWVVGEGPAPRKAWRKKSHLEPIKLLRILAEGYVVAADRTPTLTSTTTTTTTTTTQPSGDASSNPSFSSPGQEADSGGKGKGGGTKVKGMAKAKDENNHEETAAVVEQEERLLPFWQLPVYSDERYRPYAKVAALALWKERLVMEFRVEHQQTQMDVYKEYYEVVLAKCKRRTNGTPAPAERTADQPSKKKLSKERQTIATKMRELYESAYALKDPMLRGR